MSIQRNNLLSLSFSLSLHAFVLAWFLVGTASDDSEWQGGSDEATETGTIIWVEVQSAEAPKTPQGLIEPVPQKSVQPTPAGQGRGGSPKPALGSGDGFADLGHQDPSILESIRGRLERYKYYPEQARRNGVEGVVRLSFQLKQNGELLDAKIISSSGVRILDEEALATLQRAQPFPYWQGLITLALRFALPEET